ncbi:MAG: hypothetical protein ACRD36_02585, partial [Candidatus Acidiferrum sp.]
NQEGRKLKDAVADLLRKGLAADPAQSPTVVKANEAMLQRRKELTRKFLSGEWGLELAGYEETKEADRRKSAERARAWRD